MALSGVSSSWGSLDLAIALARQAVHQDTARNYEEAARCYREAVVHFRTAADSGRCTKRVRQAVEEKCELYEKRLRRLDRHLLSKADLTKLFRDCVEHELKSEEESSSNGGSGRASRSSFVSSDSGNSGSDASVVSERSFNSEVLAENPYLKKGLNVIEKGKREDER